ncbi:MAG: hypothetical protein M1832_005276 [Thelocarpon impressellum]|nr:MAG: hypothetical protein M1832_005276 [Thelocarpon impressellum]
MSSGSLRELARALGQALSPAIPPYPLPSDVHDTIQAYLDRHPHVVDHDSQRLQDELLAVYRRCVAGDERKHATFLAVLRPLVPAIAGPDRLLEWWTLLLRPTMESLGQHKGVVSDARELLLSVLVFDDDDDPTGERARVSAIFTDKLLDVYLDQTRIRSVADADSPAADSQSASFIAGHLESVLVAFGRRRPRNLLVAIDGLVVRSEHRVQALSLLCTFVRHQPPHLYEVLKTPLLDHLLQCLMIDTSTTVVALALTTLLMFLPHVPSSLVPYLPRLFAVYARLVCWERPLPSPTDDEPLLERADPDKAAASPASEPGLYADPAWDTLHRSPDAADAAAPDLTHYFTFLYGLYPLNLASFIRKPAKYLRDAHFPVADELALDQRAIHHRTEPFRHLHLLHPNFYTTTVDNELADTSRFLESEPADVVAECMGLCAAPPVALNDPGPPPSGKLPVIPESHVATEDIPPQTLLAPDDGSTLANGDDGSPVGRGAPVSWRNTQSTAMSSNFPEPPRLSRKTSQHTPPRSNGAHSRLPSPARTSEHAQDSPTLPAHLVPSSSDTNLKDMLQAQESLRTTVQQSHPNDSSHSLSAHDTPSPRLEAYIQSLSSTSASRSPAPRLKPTGPLPNVAFLQREILLLKNDLNFERYLKQQHLSHIGQLQRKYIREATVEAETQKLINSNRALRLKQEESKKTLAMLRKETLASKGHAKRWEGELHQKARALREDQRRWTAEEDGLRRELRDAREEADRLRGLVVASEARELTSRQKMQSVELNLDELDRLRAEVEALNAQLREYEAREEEFEFGRQNEEIARTQLETLRMKLKARDADREKMKRGYEQRIDELEARVTPPKGGLAPANPQAFQSMLDSALASSQARFAQLKKVYNHLLTRYAELEMRYMELQATHEPDGSFTSGSRGHAYGGDDFDFFGQDDAGGDFGRRHLATSDPHDAQRHGLPLSEPFSSSYPTHPRSLESLSGPDIGTSNSNSPVVERMTPFETSLAQYRSNRSEGSEHSGAATAATANTKAKIKASSEARVYGRGGVQNIGKKAKPPGKEKEKKALKPGAALKGIRGFV